MRATVSRLSFVMMSLLTLAPAAGGAQMPGVPVLQNAFANPGITAALDVASQGGASTYGLAAGWAPGSARFQLSAGLGIQTRTKTPNRTVYGGRVNVPVYGTRGGSLGASLFGGLGALAGRDLDSGLAKNVIPAGATISYRLNLGASHGVSVYGSPMYQWITRGGSAGNTSVFRVSAGLDVAVTNAIGLTLGVELGQTGEPGSGKPTNTAFGAGLSYVLGGAR
jgi:hypothetical protein